ncbi:hypothetical protein PMIN06_008799 [Paraphaeosphaeria minitans]
MSPPSTPSRNAAVGQSAKTSKSPLPVDDTLQKDVRSLSNKSNKSTGAGSNMETPELVVSAPAFFTMVERKSTRANFQRLASISEYSHSPAPTDASTPIERGTQQPKKLPPLYTTALPAKNPNQREPDHLKTEEIVMRLRHPNRALYIGNGTKEENGKMRRILNNRTQLYWHGRSMGVPKAVHDWLCSDPAAEEMVFDASIFG